MGDFMKMLDARKMMFCQQNPMLELHISPQDIYPAVLAIENKMKDDVVKSKQSWEQTKSYFGKSEKSSSNIQKPDKQEIAKSEKETNSYLLVYFNPESNKAEIVEGSVTINYEDETQQVIEEALGMRSAYGIYSFVASQMVMEKVDEQMLKEIMDKIRIESPDKFGDGAAVKVNYGSLSPKIVEEYGETLIALQIAEKRKLNLEERMEAQMKIVGELIKQLDDPHDPTRKMVEALPPLSRARTLALFRKKRISRKEVHSLLTKDYLFLKAAKEKVSAMRVGDILRVVMKIKEKE